MANVESTERIHDAKGYFGRLSRVLAGLSLDQVDEISSILWEAYQSHRTIFLLGNGGSASLASHFACDLGKGTVVDHEGNRLRVIALTDNIPTITAWANDFSYDDIFSEQLKNMVQACDVVVGISCSGNSRNVLKALTVAHERGAVTVGLGGFEGGKMKSVCDVCLVVPSNNMQLIEDLHLSVAHALFTILTARIYESNPAKAAAMRI
jgi:D-sedoheptulose 7-phosphate isomerase